MMKLKIKEGPITGLENDRPNVIETGTDMTFCAIDLSFGRPPRIAACKL